MIKKQRIEKIKKICQYKSGYSRLMIEVRNVGFFYDIGIRAIEDPHRLLSKKVIKSNNQATVYGMHDHPRFLEDFVEKYGKRNITVYTSLVFKSKDVTTELLNEIDKLEEI